MIPQPEDGLPGYTYYMTLMRDDLQVRLGECVYLVGEEYCKALTSDGTPIRCSYTELTSVSREKLDIFHVERLWKDQK